MRVIGDVLPPEHRGASVFLDPAGNGSLAGPGDMRNPNSGPPMAMPPQPESILLRENGTWGRLYTMSLPPIQVTADKPEEEEEEAP
ncbi:MULTISPECIES: hypothetical protein, partial [unclassified Pseudomonas]|uniref:hypothetical protein n=1 Tax=unclassified Pseudomonas TaxID=196821 RepID=UPI002446D127